MNVWMLLDRIFLCHCERVLAAMDLVLKHQNKIQVALDRLDKKLMSLKEDFAAFVVSVNDRTNEISVALDDIKLDIEFLKNNVNTPPEVAASMAEIQAKLQGLSDVSKEIASATDSSVPPVV